MTQVRQWLKYFKYFLLSSRPIHKSDIIIVLMFLYIFVLWIAGSYIFTISAARRDGAPGLGGGGASQQGGEQDVKDCQGKRQK